MPSPMDLCRFSVHQCPCLQFALAGNYGFCFDHRRGAAPGKPPRGHHSASSPATVSAPGAGSGKRARKQVQSFQAGPASGKRLRNDRPSTGAKQDHGGAAAAAAKIVNQIDKMTKLTKLNAKAEAEAAAAVLAVFPAAAEVFPAAAAAITAPEEDASEEDESEEDESEEDDEAWLAQARLRLLTGDSKPEPLKPRPKQKKAAAAARPQVGTTASVGLQNRKCKYCSKVRPPPTHPPSRRSLRKTPPDSHRQRVINSVRSPGQLRLLPQAPGQRNPACRSAAAQEAAEDQRQLAFVSWQNDIVFGPTPFSCQVLLPFLF